MTINVEQYRREPLYISDFQKWIESLELSQSCKVIIHIKLGGDRCRWLEFRMPIGETLVEIPQIVQRYLLAMMNNMVVSFGGELMELYYPKDDAVLNDLFQNAAEFFQTETPSHQRSGYGVFINYVNRINGLLGYSNFRIVFRDISQWRAPLKSSIAKIYQPGDEKEELEKLRRAATSLTGKSFCSLDIGGNSIKCAVVRDGEILLLKEHKWFPTGCKTAEEFLSPILLLTRLLRACAMVYDQNSKLVEKVLGKVYSDVELAEPIDELEGMYEVGDYLFDAVTIGFPDIVINNKVTGGETLKQKGMKEHSGENYDKVFAKTVDLDDMVRPFVKSDGTVVVLNDGNAAAFLTSVEQAFTDNSIIAENGMFANTIGTEMGTGFISRSGTIQTFPLEGYQFVIDLGNTDYAKYPANDIRSINNRGTGIPGTVQKTITQLGLFRLAITSLMEHSPKIFWHLKEKGLLDYNQKDDLLTIVEQPVDRRGALTQELMEMLEQGNPEIIDAFSTMGKAMGVHIDQCGLVFPELAPARLLSGGIVAPNCAFEEMLKGLEQHNETYMLTRLDENILRSPLFEKIQHMERTFVVAIGSAYIGNYVLMNDLEDEKQ